ncbi:hypothetical protein HPB47_000906 [Ixodes persulcatus]|uniref:Uncharacterized protein n=1 Tax=Ixodes persulcatus TaxID=34615 RepID=A0AC60PQL3_IXOPE|nr:hypothetical protein HPB47_000906 [Ixodes persulcatus]
MGGFLERAAALARALNSPHLVEKVQNCFGVHRVVENGRSGDKLRHSNGLTHRHGSTNGASSKATTGRGGGVVLRDTSVPCRVDSALWYYLFHFGSLLGYEMFYATFFPFLLWNFDCGRVPPGACRVGAGAVLRRGRQGRDPLAAAELATRRPV